MTLPAGIQLFHRLTDAASADARRTVIEAGMKERVAFRNVHFDEAAMDLRDVGGGETLPALWDGTRLHEGLPAVLEALRALG